LLAGVSQKDFNLINDLNLEYVKVKRVSNPSNNPILFALKARKEILREGLDSDFLISSDLYFGFISTWLISKFLKSGHQIQISIHGSLNSQDESFSSKIIRKFYLSFVMRNANSIRFVSDFLRNEVIKSFQIPSKSLFVSPIPVKVPVRLNISSKDNVLAFVGRLHPERGVTEWTDVVSALYKRRPDFRVKIVGDGLLSDEVKLALMKNCEGLEIEFLGRLDHEKLSLEWHSIKVLLSSAPKEGYGLAIREAIASSSFVCARASEGAEVLSKNYNDVVKTYSTVDQAVEIISNFFDIDFPLGVSENIQSDLQTQNDNHLKVLVSTWLQN
jgi:glycosyltransferase involved in cell wall biosynthesis